MQDETVWISLDQMSKLFDRDKGLKGIINNIYQSFDGKMFIL